MFISGDKCVCVLSEINAFVFYLVSDQYCMSFVNHVIANSLHVPLVGSNIGTGYI